MSDMICQSVSLSRRATRYRVWVCVILFGLASLPSATGAQTATTGRPTPDVLLARVNSYFAPIVANHDFAGAVLVARGNKVLVDRAYGVADPDLDVASSTAHRYRIASLTKTFTAAAIVVLAERGTLRLDDPLSRFLPDFPPGPLPAMAVFGRTVQGQLLRPCLQHRQHPP